jgi:membrane-bound serine protease (ClpP class)
VSPIPFAALLVTLLTPALPPGLAGTQGTGPVVVVPIHGQLDEAMMTLTVRGVREAHEEHARALVFEIDSEGGSIELMDRVIDEIERAHDLTTVAFVTQKAASAGALIAISCQRLYMKPATNIGSAVPILISLIGGEGKPGVLLLSRDNPAEFEKMSSHLRAHFRAKAQANGRSPALAEAMVDPNVAAYEIEVDGTRSFATEHDTMELVAQHGEAAVRKVREICPRGKVLNMTAQEAQLAGFIDGIAASREDLLAQLGMASAEVRFIAPSWTDRLAQFTRAFGWLLILVGLIALFIEMKVPGFGLPGLVGIACLTVYLAGNYVAGVADWGEILLVMLGFALVAVEVFALPGTLLPGLLGIIAVVVGLVAASQTTLLPQSDRPWAEAVWWENVRTLSLTIVGVVATMLVLAWAFPNVPILNRAVLRTAAGSAGVAPALAVILPASGAPGDTKTPLRPAGKVIVDGREYDASSEGPFIEAGRAVVVLRSEGSHLIVRVTAPDPDAKGARPG